MLGSSAVSRVPSWKPRCQPYRRCLAPRATLGPKAPREPRARKGALALWARLALPEKLGRKVRLVALVPSALQVRKAIRAP